MDVAWPSGWGKSVKTRPAALSHSIAGTLAATGHWEGSGRGTIGVQLCQAWFYDIGPCGDSHVPSQGVLMSWH
jgi:hypothetical protein